ncbi:hypothetical protein NA78x_002787 [Anatilimnocola sp. NA78]|uniref:hypothetical protein n=1 Tax=Anatilimnocola sp. NA78 TaxID=3415683 RepID=UPI003CE5B0AC
MDSIKEARIREALRQLAVAHAAAMQQMEQALALLAEMLLPDAGEPLRGARPPPARFEIDRLLFAIKFGGKCCFLGNTLPFRFIERLAAQPNTFLSYEDLLSEVWESNVSDSAIRSVTKRLRKALCSRGMREVADAIDGSVAGHYSLKLPIEERKMPQR